jgi:hypothetical protein
MTEDDRTIDAIEAGSFPDNEYWYGAMRNYLVGHLNPPTIH